MKVFTMAAVCASGLGLMGGTLLGGAAVAGASTEPPPVIVRSPHSEHLALGGYFTFKAAARDASTVLWVVKSPDGSSFKTYSGVNTTSRSGVLKSSFTFGPFTASEEGWEVGAAFINDPTGVPSGIQESDTTPAVVTQKRTARG
jgi:hypothetical protein